MDTQQTPIDLSTINNTLTNNTYELYVRKKTFSSQHSAPFYYNLIDYKLVTNKAGPNTPDHRPTKRTTTPTTTPDTTSSTTYQKFTKQLTTNKNPRLSSNALLQRVTTTTTNQAISTLTSSVEDEAYTIKRSDFPNGFLFGTSTSAYQIEGAFQEDGKGLSNWDVYCRIEGSIEDGSNGDFAVDHYHRYMEDIEIMHSLGLTAYRFSISWSRLLPRGSYGEVNQAAILFYNRIIDNLLLRGIEPFVTLFHFELPQELEDRFGSWLSPQMQEEFVHFAKTCFENFGDRVRHWITLNEPNVFAEKAYQTALDPPARCSPPFGHCAVGNSDIEPLIAMHNMMLAHAKAAKLYREQFKSKMDGMLGTTVGAFMYVPLTDDKYDYEATKRAFAFNIGWSLDPLVSGDYPPEMKHIHGPELPRFSSEERLLLKNSIDFIGINHYGALYVKDCIHSSCICHDSGCLPGGDRPVRGFLSTSGERNGVLIGEYTGMTQFYVTPKFMEDMVNYFKEKYQNMPMFITENGYATPLDENDDYHNDLKRVTFLESYLA